MLESLGAENLSEILKKENHCLVAFVQNTLANQLGGNIFTHDINDIGSEFSLSIGMAQHVLRGKQT